MKHRYSSKNRLTNHGHGSAYETPTGQINPCLGASMRINGEDYR